MRGEQSLCYRPRHGLLEHPSASDSFNDVLVHPFDENFVLVLERQRKDVATPRYHKCGVISGTLIPNSATLESITSVTFQVSTLSLNTA
jgi:hypothetical protein